CRVLSLLQFSHYFFPPRHAVLHECSRVSTYCCGEALQLLRRSPPVGMRNSLADACPHRPSRAELWPARTPSSALINPASEKSAMWPAILSSRSGVMVFLLRKCRATGKALR